MCLFADFFLEIVTIGWTLIENLALRCWKVTDKMHHSGEFARGKEVGRKLGRPSEMGRPKKCKAVGAKH